MIGVESITSSLKNLFNSNFRKPANLIPAIILGCSLAKRPGLSLLVSTGNVIQDAAENGIPTDPLPDGSPNKMNILIHSILKELIRALKEDVNIQISIPPGSINVVATGANAGGPVTVTGSNINFGSGVALIQ